VGDLLVSKMECSLRFPVGAPESDMTDLITVDREILGGTPVFKGTRLPIQTLFDYLEDNYALDEFLESFPSVSKEMAVGILETTALSTPGAFDSVDQ
jgi:uncharacterized protein (DUF433 family)